MTKKKVTGGRAGEDANRDKKAGGARSGSESNASKSKPARKATTRQAENTRKQAGSGKNDPDNVARSGGEVTTRKTANGRNRTA